MTFASGLLLLEQKSRRCVWRCNGHRVTVIESSASIFAHLTGRLFLFLFLEYD